MSSLLTRLATAGLALILLLASGFALAHDDYVACYSPHSGTVPDMSSGRIDILNEGFEGAWPPAGWGVINLGGTYTWDQTSIMAHSGEYSAWVHYGSQDYPQDEWLVTPALDFADLLNPKLEFFEDEEYWVGYGDHHYIAVSTSSQTDPGAFTVIAEMTPADHEISGFDGDPLTFSLSDYAGESVVYVAFRYTGTYADDWFIDDVRIYEHYEHDVRALAALPDDEQFPGGTPVTPQGVVENVGLNTESFDVRMEISESGAAVYSETAYVSGLAADSVATVDFPAITVGSGQYYELTFTTLLATDGDPANNQAAGLFDSYTETHVPLGFLFTNSACAPCVAANQALDAYLETAGNAVGLMRIHTWWPNPADPMYTENPEQIDALVAEYGVSYVPDFWLDGFWGLGYQADDMTAALDEGRAWMSPLTVTPMLWCLSSDRLTVIINIVNPLPAGDYRLFCNITEDGIEHDGGNGEPIHNQAFRYQYPDLEGIGISTVLGTHQIVVDIPLGDGWIFDELRATVYVMEMGAHEIWQTGTSLLVEIMDVTPVALGFFDLRPAAGSVTLAWETAGPGDYEFRLLRIDDGAGIELEYDSPEPGRYEATDLLPGGGRFTYQLHGREVGEDWLLLRSENVIVDAALPDTRILGGYPNPFNPRTTIRFSLEQAGPVRVSVFDLEGRLVTTLFEGIKAAGEHDLVWQGRDDAGRAMGSGVYFVSLQAEGRADSRKIVLTK